MPRVPMKKPKGKLALDNLDIEFDKDMVQEPTKEECKPDPFGGSGGNCAEEEEDGAEDKSVLMKYAPKRKSNGIDGDDFMNNAMKNFNDSVKKQEMSRKRHRANVQCSLAAVLKQMEADGVTLQESYQQQQQLCRTQLKVSQQIETTHRNSVQRVREFNEAYTKMSQDMETQDQEARRRVQAELTVKVKQMQEKLVAEHRVKSADVLKKAFSDLCGL